jgi:hypothetical protein
VKSVNLNLEEFVRNENPNNRGGERMKILLLSIGIIALMIGIFGMSAGNRIMSILLMISGLINIIGYWIIRKEEDEQLTTISEGKE